MSFRLIEILIADKWGVNMSNEKCSHCSSHDTSEILYGLPAFSMSLEKRLEAHEIVLGGCCIDEDSPVYHCHACKKDFGKLPAYDYL